MQDRITTCCRIPEARISNQSIDFRAYFCIESYELDDMMARIIGKDSGLTLTGGQVAAGSNPVSPNFFESRAKLGVIFPKKP